MKIYFNFTWFFIYFLLQFFYFLLLLLLVIIAIIHFQLLYHIYLYHHIKEYIIPIYLQITFISKFHLSMDIYQQDNHNIYKLHFLFLLLLNFPHKLNFLLVLLVNSNLMKFELKNISIIISIIFIYFYFYIFIYTIIIHQYLLIILFFSQF